MNRILRERDHLRAEHAALAIERDVLLAARDRAEEECSRATREREQADEAHRRAVAEREQAVLEREQAKREREQAEERYWQAVRDREQAEEARWKAVRAREVAEAALQATTRPRVTPSTTDGEHESVSAPDALPATGFAEAGVQWNAATADADAMKISILLANYNHGAFIRGNIEAALAQTYPHWELIVVDDGSTDDSREIIGSLAHSDPRIVPIFLPENRGAMAAIQTGLAATRGALLYGSAADDHIANDRFFETVVAALLRHPQASGVFGKAKVIDASSGEGLWEMGSSPAPGFIEPQVALKAFLTGGLFVPGAAAIWKRAHIDALGGFDEKLGPQTDFFLNHALPAVAGAVFVDEVFAVVRTGSGNYHQSGGQDEFFRRHALVESKLRALDLPSPLDPDWLHVWRDRLVNSRLAVTRQQGFFNSVRAALMDIQPSEHASLPAGFIDCTTRVLAEVNQLERDLADQVSSAHRILDTVAGPLCADELDSAATR